MGMITIHNSAPLGPAREIVIQVGPESRRYPVLGCIPLDEGMVQVYEVGPEVTT